MPMRGDIFDNPRAFQPFYTERVAVTGARSGSSEVRGSFRACVIEDGTEDGFAEGVSDTTICRIVVYIPRDGAAAWTRDIPAPQRGDRIETEDGRKFKVSEVEVMDLHQYTLHARAV